MSDPFDIDRIRKGIEERKRRDRESNAPIPVLRLGRVRTRRKDHLWMTFFFAGQISGFLLGIFVGAWLW